MNRFYSEQDKERPFQGSVLLIYYGRNFEREASMHRRVQSVPPVTLTLVILNAVFFLFQNLCGPEFTIRLALSSAGWSEPYRMVTSMFLHADPGHILRNMFALLAIGNFLEPKCGHGFFLFLYLASGISGNVLTLIQPFAFGNFLSMGASGAVSGLFAAVLAVLVFHQRRPLPFLLFYSFVFFLCFVLPGFSDSSINFYSHIGGALAGFVLELAGEGCRHFRAQK